MVGLSIFSLMMHLIHHHFGRLLWLHYPEPAFLLIKIQYFVLGILIANAAFHIRTSAISARNYLVLSLIVCTATSYTIVVVAALILFLATGFDFQTRTLSMSYTLINGLLGNSLTKFLADVSYGVYLVHGFFIGIFGGWFYSQPFTRAWSPVHRLAWLLIVTVLGAYGVSFLLHICVERPGVNLGRKILSRLKAKNSNMDKQMFPKSCH